MSRRLAATIAALLFAAPGAAEAATRTWTIHYGAADGTRRAATVLLPASYRPGSNPAIPLVISPHGRGASGVANAKRWGDLPARGRFAVVNPDGLGPYSYGAPAQIDDLARMPDLVVRALPWLRIDRTRIYAVGSSMGGQEALLLLARYPRLLAGVVAMDSVVDLARRYDEAPALRALIGGAVGSAPADDPAAYAARSPLAAVEAIAASRVPVQLWWSTADQVIRSEGAVSRELIARLAGACVAGFEGAWPHSADMRADTFLPDALQSLGLFATRLPAGRPALRASYPAPAECGRTAAGSSTSPSR
jgi:pimeloyl-ACP methyl ester carboxylesterase